MDGGSAPGSPAFYFAYGSNMNPVRMEERDVAFVAAEPGVLKDYRLRFNKRSTSMPGSGAANVMRYDGREVQGVLYELRDVSGILTLDRFEGYPKGYRRERLEVLRRNGEGVGAWVYLAQPDYVDDRLRPACSYLSHLLAARPYLTDAYYEELARVECDGDANVRAEREPR